MGLPRSSLIMGCFLLPFLYDFGWISLQISEAMDGPKARIVRYMSHESELETVQEPSGSSTGPNMGQGESVAQSVIIQSIIRKEGLTTEAS